MHFGNHKGETCELFGETGGEGALNAMARLPPELPNVHRISAREWGKPTFYESEDTVQLRLHEIRTLDCTLFELRINTMKRVMQLQYLLSQYRLASTRY